MDVGKNYDIALNISDGFAYKTATPISIGSIDYEKPAIPTFTVNNGTTVSLSSTSADVKKYYIFEGAIPEENTENSQAKLLTLSTTQATSFNLCASSTAFGSQTYRAFAIDGDTLDKSNASDAIEFNFHTILKGVSLLSNKQGTDASVFAVPYDSACTAGAIDTANAGISIRAITTDKTVYMSYIKKDVSFNTNTPLTIYVGLSTTGLAEVKYVPAYAGSAFYIEFDGVLYSGILPADDITNGYTTNALDVSGNEIITQTFN